MGLPFAALAGRISPAGAVRWVGCVLMLLVLSSIPLPARAAGGSLDRSFGAGAGYVTYAAPYQAHWQMTGAVALADGRAVIGGYMDLKYIVRRYFPDGRLDTSFGANGSTEIADLSRSRADSGVYTGPTLHQDGSGRVIAMSGGLARRLSVDGQLDSSYLPRAINVREHISYTPAGRGVFLPVSDGRMIYVSTPDAPDETNSISVRYALADGQPDTVRGDANGERLVGPVTGRYVPTDAVLQPDGKLLISAYWVQGSKIGLVLVRVNADASTDRSFGSAGVVVIGEDTAAALAPTLALNPSGAIALAFYVSEYGLPPPEQSYFVVHLLQADGQPDTRQPMSGRISVALPKESGQTVSARNLRVAYASSQLSVFADEFFWQMNLTAGGGVPAVSTLWPDQINTNPLPAVLGGGQIWRLAWDDPLFAGFTLLGFDNSVARVVAVDLLPNARPFEIRDVNPASAPTFFTDIQANPDGKLTLMGVSTLPLPRGKLLRFLSSGALDPRFGGGQVAVTEVYGLRLLDSYDDGATVLGYGPAAGTHAQWYFLVRYGSDGRREPSFADSGKLMLPEPVGQGWPNYAALRSSSGDLWAVHSLVTAGGNRAVELQPFRFDRAGNPLGAPGAVQAARSQTMSNSETAFAPTPEGRLLAAVAGADPIAGPWVQLLRWQSDGTAAAGSPGAAIFLGEPFTKLDDVDVVYQDDGGAVVALIASQNALAAQPALAVLLLRLRPDGTLDTNFAEVGKLRIGIDIASPSVPSELLRLRLLRQSDGKLVLARNMPSGSGTAIVVGRYGADGQPDPTFAANGSHEVRFTLGDAESVSDMTLAPDGKLVVVGQSGTRGLIISFVGQSTPPPASPVPIVEFYNGNLKHYFITGGAGEIAGIEAGAAGPGWSRTGGSFRAYGPETGIAPDALPVCRFYGTPGVGPNSHFYTVDPIECELVKRDRGWSYEGTAFYVFPPANGQCAASQQPVYRAYNMRFAQNDSNHRYTTDSATYAQMQAQGWAGEGVKFCGALP